jgi:hypothetical protein
MQLPHSSLPTPAVHASGSVYLISYHTISPTHLQLILADAIDRNQLGLENQHGIRRNGSSATTPVRPVRLDSKLALLAGAHVEQALVPALDDLAATDLEAQRRAAVVRGVELAAVRGERAAVVHVDLVAGNRLALAVDGRYDFGGEVLVVDDVGDGGRGQAENGGELHCEWWLCGFGLQLGNGEGQ